MHFTSKIYWCTVCVCVCVCVCLCVCECVPPETGASMYKVFPVAMEGVLEWFHSELHVRRYMLMESKQ